MRLQFTKHHVEPILKKRKTATRRPSWSPRTIAALRKVIAEGGTVDAVCGSWRNGTQKVFAVLKPLRLYEQSIDRMRRADFIAEGMTLRQVERVRLYDLRWNFADVLIDLNNLRTWPEDKVWVLEFELVKAVPLKEGA